MQSHLRVETVEVTPFQQNCRVMFIEGSPSAIVIDPGGDADRIVSMLEKNQLTLSEIWLTHSHLDHCGGVAPLLGGRDIPLLAHPGEKELRANVTKICAMYGIPEGYLFNSPEPSQFLTGGETLDFQGFQFNVLFTPGHSPGHLCFYQRDTEILIAGDTLFAGSIGRTDLPGGSHRTLLESIRSQIFTLPDATRVLPGHGPDTTVGHEKATNPFLS